jgi:hypothetical protein
VGTGLEGKKIKGMLRTLQQPDIYSDYGSFSAAKEEGHN